MRLFVFWLCICSGLLACESSKNVFYEAEREVGYDNGGKYVITRFKNPSLGDSAVIFGEYRDIDDPDYELWGCGMSINNQEWRWSADSYIYQYRLSSGLHRLRVSLISYESVTINDLELNPGDSVRIDFYLKEGDYPLH